MRRSSLGLFIIFLGSAGIAAGAPASELYVRGEYRRDAVDYENSESEFYRLKTCFMFSSKSSLNFTTVYSEGTREERHTWSLVLGDISPSLSLMIGNFNAGFGTGILLGRRSSYNPDAFTHKEPARFENVFSPAKSGNPAFAFTGIAVTAGTSLAEFTLALHSFYSTNTRYVNEDSYFSGESGSTLGTIENSLDRDYSHSEPVHIHSAGTMASMAFRDAFLIQLSWYRMLLATPMGDKISWDPGDDITGISSARGMSLLAQYTDDFVRIFCETALSMTRTGDSDSESRTVTGRGTIYGIRISPGDIMLSFTGKETQPAYYAPFGSTIGSDRPERGWFTSLDYRLCTWLSTGAAASSEKYLSPSSGDDELPYTRREEVRAKLSWRILKSSQASIRRLTQLSGSNRRRRIQYSHSNHVEPIKPVRLTFSALHQASTGTGDSSSITTGIGLKFLRENEISFFYCRTRASAENPVYTVLSPIEQSSIPGMLVRESAHTGVLRVLLRHEDLSFSMRYMRQFVDGASRRSRLEFAGSAYF